MVLAYDIVSWVSIVLLAALIWVLMGKKGLRIAANSFLAAFFGVNILLIAYFWTQSHQLIAISPYGHYLFWSPFFLLAPLLYLYVAAMCRPSFRCNRTLAWHGIAMPVAFAIGCLGYFLSQKQGAAASQFMATWNTAMVASMHLWTCGYLVAIFGQLSKYDATIKQRFSNVSHINLSWLTALIVVFVGHWLFDIAAFGLSVFTEPQPAVQVFLSIFSIGILGVFSLATVVRGLQWPETAPRVDAPEPQANEQATQEMTHLRQEILTAMAQQKAYLNPDLTLDEFATMLGYSNKAVSRCINAVLGKNFFEFVNAYRLEEAKHYLAGTTGKGKTISEILFASGFNSKATFNRIFKKETGITPTQFRNQAKARRLAGESQTLELT